MKDASEAPRRGPRPKPDPGTQTGYRVTARQRLELGVARTFTGASSLQAVLDQAVDRYLHWMKETAEGFQEAVDNAVSFQERQAGVPTIRSRRDGR